MKNNRTLFFTGLIASCMLLCACDPSTKNQRIIVNNSDHDIVVIPNITEANFGYKSDSIFVARHSRVIILENGGVSTVKEYEDCDMYVDSVHAQIVGFDSLNLTIDLGKKSNWTYFVLKKDRQGGGDCGCDIVINNEHIQ